MFTFFFSLAFQNTFQSPDISLHFTYPRPGPGPGQGLSGAVGKIVDYDGGGPSSNKTINFDVCISNIRQSRAGLDWTSDLISAEFIATITHGPHIAT